MNRLQVDVDEVYATSHAIGNEAEELRDELVVLQRDWENLSREWSGTASSAYSKIWAEWLEGATALVNALADSSHDLGAAAVGYGETDTDSAAHVDSTAIGLRL